MRRGRRVRLVHGRYHVAAIQPPCKTDYRGTTTPVPPSPLVLCLSTWAHSHAWQPPAITAAGPAPPPLRGCSSYSEKHPQNLLGHRPPHTKRYGCGDLPERMAREPPGASVSPGGRFALVAFNGSSIDRIDLQSGAVAFKHVGFSNPSGVALSPDGRFVLVANRGGSSGTQAPCRAVARASRRGPRAAAPRRGAASPRWRGRGVLRKLRGRDLGPGGCGRSTRTGHARWGQLPKGIEGATIYPSCSGLDS